MYWFKFNKEIKGKWYDVVDTVKAKCKRCCKEEINFIVLKLDIGEYDSYVGATVLCGPCVAAVRNLYTRDRCNAKFWDHSDSNGGTILCLHCGWSESISFKITSKVDREILYSWLDNKKKSHVCDHYEP